MILQRLMDFKEQHMRVKLLFGLDQTAIDTFKLLQLPFGEDKMGVTKAFDWLSKL